MSPWKSRWSRVRLVHTATCELETGHPVLHQGVGGDLHHRACPPWSRRRRSRGRGRSPRGWSVRPTAPSRPRAARSRGCREASAGPAGGGEHRPTRWTVVLLPLVPVTPTRVSSRCGSPARATLPGPSPAAVERSEPGHLRRRRRARSVSTAAAPWATASAEEVETVGVGWPGKRREDPPGLDLARVVGDPGRPRLAVPVESARRVQTADEIATSLTPPLPPSSATISRLTTAAPAGRQHRRRRWRRMPAPRRASAQKIGGRLLHRHHHHELRVRVGQEAGEPGHVMAVVEPTVGDRCWAVPVLPATRYPGPAPACRCRAHHPSSIRRRRSARAAIQDPPPPLRWQASLRVAR